MPVDGLLHSVFWFMGLNKNNSYFLLPKATVLSPKTLNTQTFIIPFTDIDYVLAPNGQKDGVKE